MNNPHRHTTDGTPEEDAYRRGFQQGAQAAIDALEFHIGEDMTYLIRRWWDAVYDWRFNASHKTMLEPPRERFE